MTHLFRALAAPIAALAVQACVPTMPAPSTVPPPQSAAPAPAGPTATPDSADAARFVAVAARVEPVAEALCRRMRTAPMNCDIQIAVDHRPGQPPNAFQTVDRSGRPYIVFSLSLIAMTRNADELAFVMGHEAAHHLAAHIPRREQNAIAGALMAGVLASASGLPPDDVKKAESYGANVGARQYSREFELEADALGAEIALLAGFDPVRGAAFFDRLPDPGAGFLNTHPPNALRQQVVARTVRQLAGE